MTRMRRAPLVASWHTALCAALVLALPAASGATAGHGESAYRQAREAATALHHTQRGQCRSLSGNARDVCMAQAKVRRVHAEARADVAYNGSDRARLVAAKHVAEADYKLARERCDARAGGARAACFKEARAAMVAAKADAKAAYGR